MRRQNAQIRHLHLSVGKNRHAVDSVPVPRKAVPKFAAKALVDLTDNAVNPRKAALHEVVCPFLEGFAHHCVIRIGDGARRDVPRGFPRIAVLIHQQAHQLRNTESGMRVVDMDRSAVGKRIQRTETAEVILDDILQGGGNEKILLF